MEAIKMFALIIVIPTIVIVAAILILIGVFA